MKKVVKVKEIMAIIISLILIVISTEVFASGLVFGDDNNASVVPKNEYENANLIPENNIDDNNNTNNNSNNNNANNNNTNGNSAKANNTKVYNTNKNNTDLPQTGIEDYNIGILLIICVASAIFAYRKITDYRNI